MAVTQYPRTSSVKATFSRSSGPAVRRTPPASTSLGFRIFGIAAALLSAAVVVIHVKDQGGLFTLKDPAYMGIGYFLLEAAGILVAGALLSRLAHRSWVWLLALGVAAGPFVGFLLTRGPGLPSAMDDRGNWTEPLGLMSLAAEGLLLALCLTILYRRGRAGATVGARA